MIRLAAALCPAMIVFAAAMSMATGWLPFGATGDSAAVAQSRTVPAASQTAIAPPRSMLPPDIKAVLRSGVLIVISKPSQRMYVFRDGVSWGASPVSTGRRGHSTPTGVFPILQKRPFHRSNIYSNAPMPFMQRLTWGGIAIHAGYLPGYPASHGCIRLPRAFAQALYALTKASATTVVITDGAVRSDNHARMLALNTPMPRPARPDMPDVAPAAQLAAAAVSPRISALPLVPAVPAAPGETIQLAASATPGEADAYWMRMVASRPELARFQKAVIPTVVGSRQVYRLRVTAPGARATCASLRSDGYACFNVS